MTADLFESSVRMLLPSWLQDVFPFRSVITFDVNRVRDLKSLKLGTAPRINERVNAVRPISRKEEKLRVRENLPNGIDPKRVSRRFINEPLLTEGGPVATAHVTAQLRCYVVCPNDLRVVRREAWRMHELPDPVAFAFQRTKVRRR
jgi:hypothetical protein